MLAASAARKKQRTARWQVGLLQRDTLVQYNKIMRPWHHGFISFCALIVAKGMVFSMKDNKDAVKRQARTVAESEEAYSMENEACCSPEFPQGCITSEEDNA